MHNKTHEDKRRSHKNELAEANKEIDRLNQLIERVKASKSRYDLQVETRKNHNEEIRTLKKSYTIKSDAQTDLIYEYYQLTGKQLERAPDFIRYVSDDGSTVGNFEIVKVKAL